jgi:hypothetical protein
MSKARVPRGRRGRRWTGPAALAIAAAVIAIALGTWGPWRSTPPVASAPIDATPNTSHLPLEDARPILDRFAAELPAELRQRDRLSDQSWIDWLRKQDADVRSRIARGEEDSVVNFWLYGTTFTRHPRATREVLDAMDTDGVARIVGGRLEDLVTAATTTGPTNGRLRLTRQVLARQGIDPTAPDGRARAWDYLNAIRSRMAAEEESYERTIVSAARASDDQRLTLYATLFDERGLSSDTGMPIGFAVDRSLAELAGAGHLAPGEIDRVGIVGPGLDFTDKAEGYDFYPQQTIQPFAIIDSLLRLGLADRRNLVVTTMDVSARVTGHLETARELANRGASYRLHLPLDEDTSGHTWQAPLVEYWQALGGRIGVPVPGVKPPAGLDHVRVRAVDVRPEVVLALRPRDVNIVVEHLDPLPDEEKFDLVVATNVLLYYGPFEQALALANITRMLRPGGFLVTSDAVYPVAPLDTAPAQVNAVERDREGLRDTIFAYERH